MCATHPAQSTRAQKCVPGIGGVCQMHPRHWWWRMCVAHAQLDCDDSWLCVTHTQLGCVWHTPRALDDCVWHTHPSRRLCAANTPEPYKLPHKISICCKRCVVLSFIAGPSIRVCVRRLLHMYHRMWAVTHSSVSLVYTQRSHTNKHQNAQTHT